MGKIKSIFRKLSKTQKVTLILLVFAVILFASFSIPSLAKYKNRSTIILSSVWDGSVANSYKSGDGTSINPYVISSAPELAYFSNQLSTNNYENTYFILENDIKLNDGTFRYDETDGITYILNNVTYYVDQYTNKYYSDIEKLGQEVGTLNTFNSLDGFKGYFLGNSYTIYGLYITSNNASELALFTNLEGNISDLYIENSLVYGGIYTSLLVSSITSSTINNVVVDGIVVGSNSDISRTDINDITNLTYNLNNETVANNILLTNTFATIGSEILNTSITGTYTLTDNNSNTVVNINGTDINEGEFNIALGTNILSSTPITITSDSDVEINLTNIKYNVTYKQAIAGGIVGVSYDSTLNNVINKAEIYGYNVSGGLIGTAINGINLNNSYNIGNVNSENISGGIIGVLEKVTNNISISKIYNTGEIESLIKGNLIGNISNNTGIITIDKTFSTNTINSSINTINNSTVNVTNSFYISSDNAVATSNLNNGSFTLTTLENLNNKIFITQNLFPDEFVSIEDYIINNQNVWVIKDHSLPTLFIDEVNNPIAKIYTNVYTWDNLSYELNEIILNSNIVFSIQGTSNPSNIETIYYYVHPSKIALNNEEISAINSWITYSDASYISNEGEYIIYVKIIDNNGNITYINTDILVLDKVDITIANSKWITNKNILDYVYIDKPEYLYINHNENLVDVIDVKYYISDEYLDNNAIDLIPFNSWITYTSPILISEEGTYVIYVKITDKDNIDTYINTDYIVFSGYTSNIITNEESNYITDKSSIDLNYTYQNEHSYLGNYTHNLMSNILLPNGTKIMLKDNITNKRYEYKITTSDDLYNFNDSCNIDTCTRVATYPLTLFKEIGTNEIYKYFIESTYYSNGLINENFTFNIDFSDTNIETNYDNVNIYMEIHDQDNNRFIPTLVSTLDSFNIYKTVNNLSTSNDLLLSTSYNNTILLNTPLVTEIPISIVTNFKEINGNKVVDTTLKNKFLGIKVKVVDNNLNIISKNDLNNISFQIGDTTYYPSNDNITYIPLLNTVSNINNTLRVVINSLNSNLNNGNYSIKISGYTSYKNNYSSNSLSNEITIPLVLTKELLVSDYEFDAKLNGSYIINKENENEDISFDILTNGIFNNPSLRVSLYEKEELTAYNQDYRLVDLNDYITDTLTSTGNSTYRITNDIVLYDETLETYNHFDLEVITENFNNTGYKFVFELYEGNIRVGIVEKYIIVK